MNTDKLLHLPLNAVYVYLTNLQKQYCIILYWEDFTSCRPEMSFIQINVLLVSQQLKGAIIALVFCYQ